MTKKSEKEKKRKAIEENAEENRNTPKKKRYIKTLVASAVIYPDSMKQPQLDADGTTWKDRILGKGKHGLKGVTGFLSPLHDKDSQRDAYTIKPEENNYGVDVTYEKTNKAGNVKTKSIQFAGSLALFIHLAGAAKNGGKEVKALGLVRKTMAFLANNEGNKVNDKLYKDDPRYFLEDFTREVLANATEHDLKELPKGFVIDKDQEWDYKQADNSEENGALLHVPTYQMLMDHLYKKPHYHLTLILLGEKPLGLRSFIAKIRASLGQTSVSEATIQPLYTTVEQLYLYASHSSAEAISEHKHEYDPNDMLLLPGFDLDDYQYGSKEQRLRCLNFARKVMQIIYDLKSSDLKPAKFLEYVCTSQDLAHYWSASTLSEAINDAWVQVLTQGIDENKNKMMSLTESVKTTDLEEESTSNSIRVRLSEYKLMNARFKKDLDYCHEITNAIADGTFPSDRLLFDSQVSYRASFKDLYEGHRRLAERERLGK